MAAATGEGPAATEPRAAGSATAKDPDRIATSLIVAGVIFLIIAVADTVVVRGFGVGTLWGSLVGGWLLLMAWLNWRKRAPRPS
jgi:hypothetical protein